MGFAAIALTALLAFQQHAANPNEVISEVTEQDVVAAATALGWTTSEVDRTVDGGFHRTFIMSNGVPAVVYGLECEGQPLRCTGYHMSLHFGLPDRKRAENAKAKLEYLYAQVVVGTPWSFEIARAEFLSGGITRKHLELSLETFGITAIDAANKVFPCGFPVGGQEPECEANKDLSN